MTTIPKPDKAAVFEFYWKILGDSTYQYVTEFEFSLERNWRFDVAFNKQKVAIEIDGGVWSGGRHVRPKGFLNDLEKINMAIECGWVVLRYEPNQFEDDPSQHIEQVLRVLKNRD